jgi:deoxyribodipyrimidine photo-lyase
MQAVNIFWFRRDLRLHDNTGLYHAVQNGLPVLPIFIFDRNILDQLGQKADARVEFIHNTIQLLQHQLNRHGSGIRVFYDFPQNGFEFLTDNYNIAGVYCNHDYEPYAIERDNTIRDQLRRQAVSFHSFKDQVIFEKDEIVKDDHGPYSVFTPYSRKWKSVLSEEHLREHTHKDPFKNLLRFSADAIPSLNSMGFQKTGRHFPEASPDDKLMEAYDKRRDFPALASTSRLGVHLRFGTISIRNLVSKALKLNHTYLNELIWREFYQMILWNFPRVGRGEAFRVEYDTIRWRNNEEEFGRWCTGTTGYPIVDAGMRELNATGFMHNRVRMIVASFLSKHLLIDWRWGEAYFAEKLLDFELASNNGGWQWAAGSGCDAAPYFRIFNPYLQTKKFDPDLAYIRRWVPELEEFSYPKPIVEHEFARERCLRVYSEALKESKAHKPSPGNSEMKT